MTAEHHTFIDNTTPTLAQYAQRAYLEYALSVVKGRALPDVADGQKPVQRRLLYAMSRMGLSWGEGSSGARPVKSARVVGDVLGRFHPHGDQAAYDALVRMAQDFNQRYPLIDGQGNFGSRDGDGAAAMRYTEARLSRMATLLTDELDMGTTHYVPNYDGSTQEPQQLPARLPFSLLNGASGIAVGMACEIPSHNLCEVADACLALLEQPDLPEADLMAILPGPDYAGGGHIISDAADIAEAYRTGRGSLKVRARWTIEDLARGQWQLVITELPPGVSTQKVLEEIEDITNPRIKTGKKALTPEQSQLKAHLLSLLDGVRDESGKDAPVRIVLEPRSRSVAQDEFINTLLAHTSLETSCSINLTGVGLDGRPTQHSLRQLLLQWIDFRRQTITRRSQHRLEQVRERMHLLQGRQIVLLHIDAVIAIIRTSDEPRDELMQRFGLSHAQAEDILDIRLRQLARLEAIKIEQELSRLGQEHDVLQDVLGNPASLQKLMADEIRHDAETFGDARRTLIQPQRRASAEVRVQDEAVTVIVSEKGWVRSRGGHGHDAASFQFKPGDALYATFECRSVDSLIAFGSNGRVYSVAASALPGGRGDGQPITSLIDLEAGTQLVHYFAGSASTRLLLTHSGGYGFIASVGDMHTRQRAGKAFISCNADEALCPPVCIDNGQHTPGNTERTTACADRGSTGDAGIHAHSASSAIGMADDAPTSRLSVACLSSGSRLLTFGLDELRTMPGGGRGLMLMSLPAGDTLVGVTVYRNSIRISGAGRGGKLRSETFDSRSLEQARAARGRKGREVPLSFRMQCVECADTEESATQ